MAEIKAHEFDQFAKRRARDFRIFLVYGPDRGLVFCNQPFRRMFAMRREWLADLVAPHVNFAARISTPGGHGADWGDQSTTIWINTPEAARAAVERLKPYKPDLIKAFTDG